MHFHAFPGRKQVSITPSCCWEKASNFPPYFFPLDFAFSYSFLTVLKIAAYWYSSVSGLEISQHNLILLPGGTVKICPWFSTQILPTSDYFRTVIKVFAYWYSSISGLEISQHNLILLPGRRVKFRPFFIFDPDFALFWFFSNCHKSICLLIFMRSRVGNKSL